MHRYAMEEINGYIERITFQNDENGYTVAQLQEPRKANLTCIVGVMPGLQPGETLRCRGEWKRHLVHGNQFEVKEHRIEAPSDIVGIKKYLGSGLIKGIGPAYAGKIVDAFGIKTLEIIDKEPERLLEIKGLGKKKLKSIKECWDAQKSIRDVMIFLQAHGVSPSYAQKIYKAYGDTCVQKVQENPYALARDIFGIGFKTADRIASTLGITKDSPRRVEAGIEHVLSELSNEGHVCSPVDLFLEAAKNTLDVDKSLIEEGIRRCTEENRIVASPLVNAGALQDFIWSKPLHASETGIAKEMHRLIKEHAHLRPVDIEKALEWVQAKLGLQLGKQQKEAVGNALSKKMQIITGGPGTGKSTITKAILCVTEKLTDKILLAAPTGRAAKRMSEITGKQAYTIHSLLEFNFKAGGFKRNRSNPLECDLIIVDEASMIDTLLMYSLLKAIPGHARVVFVGDINQLPSVGPGNVLKDIIGSRCIPVTTLNEIFRQAAGSRIVTNAHRINNGVFPEIQSQPDSDFYFLEAQEPESALNEILSLVTQRLPKKYRFDPIDDIQVLAPMKKGVLGTENLNAVLQEKLNPNTSSLMRWGKKLAVKDKVMQIRNNYDKGVFNGDVGRVQSIDIEEQEAVVRFDNKSVTYDFSELDEIVLAYAVSVHKYQGSECPCIVMPVHTTHFKLLHRNLLYTGITRGKSLVILVGTTKALAIAVRNDEVKRRYTGLQQALAETNGKGAPFL